VIDEARRQQLVGHLQPAFVPDLLNEATRNCLVLLDRHLSLPDAVPPHLSSASSPQRRGLTVTSSDASQSSAERLRRASSSYATSKPAPAAADAVALNNRSSPTGRWPSSARADTNTRGRMERTSSHLGRKLRCGPMGNGDRVRRRQPFQLASSLVPAQEWLPTLPRQTSKQLQLRRPSQAQKPIFASNPSVVGGETMITVSA
jgi:hypothetical protein